MQYILIPFVCFKGKDVNRSTDDAVNCTVFRSSVAGGLVVIQIDHNHSDVVMEMASYSFLYSLHVTVTHLPLLRSLVKCSSNQSLSYSLCIRIKMKLRHGFCNTLDIEHTRVMHSMT